MGPGDSSDSHISAPYIAGKALARSASSLHRSLNSSLGSKVQIIEYSVTNSFATGSKTPDPVARYQGMGGTTPRSGAREYSVD